MSGKIKLTIDGRFRNAEVWIEAVPGSCRISTLSKKEYPGGGYLVEPQGQEQDNKRLSSGRVREAINALSDGEKADLYKSLCFAYQDKVRSLPSEPLEQSEGPCIREGRLDRT